jgi:hypothetical protein
MRVALEQSQRQAAQAVVVLRLAEVTTDLLAPQASAQATAVNLQ